MIGAGVIGMLPNPIKILTNTGMTVHQAVIAASLVGLFVIFGRVLCGVLLDRYWVPAVAFAFLALPALSCLLRDSASVADNSQADQRITPDPGRLQALGGSGGSDGSGVPGPFTPSVRSAHP